MSQESRSTKILTGVLFLIIVVLITVFIIKPGEEEKGTLETGKPEKETKPLEVAVVISLTGPGASTGEDFLNGMLLAKEKFNPNIVLHVEDSQSNAKDGVTAARRLLDTKDIDVIVSLQSAVVIPLLAIAEQYDKPLIATIVAQNEFAKSSKYAFRLFSPARDYAAMAAEFANKKDFKNISTLTIHDEYGESIKEHFKKNFKGNIPHEESFEVLERDFRTVLTKLSDSEAIYSVGFDIHWVSLFEQRQELGKDIPFISNQNMVSSFVKSKVGELFTNAYATIPPSTLITKQTNEFVDEYNKKYGRKPDWGAPFGYDTVLILDAVQKSSKKPIDALHEIRVSGLNGLIRFDEEGEANIPLVVVEVKDGIVDLVEE